MPSAVSGRHWPGRVADREHLAHRGAEQPVREIGAVVGAGRDAVITQEALERGLELGAADVGAETDQAPAAHRKDPAEALGDQPAVQQEGQALVLRARCGSRARRSDAAGRGSGVRAADQRAPPARAVHDHRRGEPSLPGRRPPLLDAGHRGAQEAHAGTGRAAPAEGPVVEGAERAPRRDRSGPCGSACGSRAGRGPAGRWRDTPRASGTQSGVPHADVCTLPTSLRSRSRISPWSWRATARPPKLAPTTMAS